MKQFQLSVTVALKKTEATFIALSLYEKTAAEERRVVLFVKQPCDRRRSERNIPHKMSLYVCVVFYQLCYGNSSETAASAADDDTDLPVTALPRLFFPLLLFACCPVFCPSCCFLLWLLLLLLTESLVLICSDCSRCKGVLLSHVVAVSFEAAAVRVLSALAQGRRSYPGGLLLFVKAVAAKII